MPGGARLCEEGGWRIELRDLAEELAEDASAFGWGQAPLSPATTKRTGSAWSARSIRPAIWEFRFPLSVTHRPFARAAAGACPGA